MAAGLGFKTFTTGEVLTAADVNGYLMQGVLVFADAAARTSAITSPQEGQYSFLKDTNALEYYDGASWVGAPVGDITAVNAGTGISGGGSSGSVTITNSMATEITAKGDLIVGTGNATFDNLPVGTNGYTLVADSVETTGLKWAAPSAPSYVGASGYLSTSVSANNATITKMILNNENFDTDSILDTSTNQGRFTVPSGKGGKWLLNAAVLFQGATVNTTVWVYAYKNGSNLRYNKAAQGIANQGEIVAQLNQVFNLVAGDYIEVYVQQNSGNTLSFYVPNAEAGIQFSYLGG